MKKLAALLALAPAVPAVACDHAAPVALAAPQCACPDPAALATYSATYSAPVVQLAPVVQSYQSAVVALPTVTHSYAVGSSGYSAGSSGYSAFSSSHNAFGSGHNAFSLAQLRANRHAEHAFAQARFGNHSLAAVAGRHNASFKTGFTGHDPNDLDRAVNRAINRDLAARRQILGRDLAARRREAFASGRQAGRPVRREGEGIVTRALRVPGRILGGLFGR